MVQQQHSTPLNFVVTSTSASEQLFTQAAVDFLSALVSKFQPRLTELLAQRQQQQQYYDQGQLPDFDAATRHLREGDWRIAELPQELTKRRLEITGPVDRKMVINALNADVDVFMADFEDAQSPTWQGLLEGQINLRDANLGNISFTDANGKQYALKAQPALLIARVRGLHLPEKHILYRQQAIAGALMDFALYLFHNYQTRLARGSGIYFYLPKLEHSREAAWWADVFHFSEQYLGLNTGSIRATVLIETLPAVFQMHEILHAMRDHIAALNCGRWDYIFSYIKTLRAHPDRVLPDRQVVTMTQPFLNAYSRLLVATCHRRGALAMGGMAAFIPSKDAQQNEQILAKVYADKELERDNGHDGTWIAHPGLAATVREVFVDGLDSDNQLDQQPDISDVDQALLLQPCSGERSEQGMRMNIRVALQYISAWLDGRGCVPIYGLMEDAATAEIARTSIWQWIKHGKTLNDGRIVTAELFTTLLDEEAARVKAEVGSARWQQQPFVQAQQLLLDITTAASLTEFLTLPGYQQLP
ncbi:malate synthase A [Idiomarina xiamenensis]|uniref:malate synthase n=1 Tax=Idiomarina xiamenensis 10-D-4 TaxID=740709 RepID=K2JWF9_9GAMM|nr:malate synthase A [Idiomarina xiamenensis]EKE87676.1 malate synthase [Idiomarina xiamenensis 10-D-4]